MGTRSQLLLLLRKHPGITVSELSAHLSLTGMAVRRHLDALAAEGMAEPSAPERRGVGRPPSGWRLTDAGVELFPRRYESLAVEVLEDVREEYGSEAVEGLLARRRDKLAAEYERELEGADELRDRVALLARIRDEAGYLAEWEELADGELLLTENNCAVHRVAQRFPEVCAMELDLLRQVMGRTEVTRVQHTLGGDPVCSYRICARNGEEPDRR